MVKERVKSVDVFNKVEVKDDFRKSFGSVEKNSEKFKALEAVVIYENQINPAGYFDLTAGCVGGEYYVAPTPVDKEKTRKRFLENGSEEFRNIFIEAAGWCEQDDFWENRAKIIRNELRQVGHRSLGEMIGLRKGKR